MIRANGSLVLGQDQDLKGGKFEAHQSFIGEMTGVNIWDHVIKDQEIARMSKSCLTGVGNVFQWREFKAHIKGSVKIIKPSCWSENIHDMICEHCEGCYIKNNLWKLFVDNLMCARIFSFLSYQWVWKVTRECLDLVFLSTDEMQNKNHSHREDVFSRAINSLPVLPSPFMFVSVF